jgi:hypothetical protein
MITGVEMDENGDIVIEFATNIKLRQLEKLISLVRLEQADVQYVGSDLSDL